MEKNYESKYLHIYDTCKKRCYEIRNGTTKQKTKIKFLYGDKYNELN